ncbi:MFS transporter [Mycolicibacterium wolinskyi]|uniref:MFS transporter n=1 Tax=Mycolicibacterium wolinskyi TaxID=59750 RepID=UPI0039179999
MTVIDDGSKVGTVRPAKVAFASFVGTAIEWYDFFIFGTAAALVFGVAFFPTLSPLSGTLAAFATFGVAFVSRPAGAIVFGHFGDRIGRKKMLVFSLVLMGSATVMIGLIPTYDQIGLAAPILLVIARLLQGFAVGGEWGGAVLMAVEHAPPRRRAFYGSFPQAGVPAGLVLATLAFLIVERLPDEDLMAWGWRVPFLASSALLLVGMYVRLKVTESPEFERVRRSEKIVQRPIVSVLRFQRRPLAVGVFTQAASLVPFYLVTVFVLSYGPKELGLSRETILLSLLAACVLDIVTVPYASIVADRVGPRKMLIYGSVYMAVIGYPFFWLLQTGNGWAVLLAMILIVTIGHAVTYSAVAAYVAGLFPADVRYTGASVAYQMGGVVFSAPAPFIAVTLASSIPGYWALAAYLATACAATVLVLTFSKTAKVSH